MRYFFALISILFLTCENPNDPVVLGCTDNSECSYGGCACNYNQNANVSNETCEYPQENYDCDGNCLLDLDCNSECGGTATEDDCGVCNGDNSTCEDCDGVSGGTAVEDCTGECGGTAVEDCAGECGGSAVEDCAGECGGTAVEDCAGECGGSAAVDDCGDCNGNNTAQDCLGTCYGNAVIDCNGDCNGGAVVDACGVCDGSVSDEWIESDLEWQLIWSDDFDQPEINEDNWNFEVWGPGQFNNEAQAYTSSINNAYIDNGKLVIKALRENLDLNNDQIPDTQYTSARLTTQNKKYHVYETSCGDCPEGKIKIEVRAKLPIGIGTWPAIWMMPNNSEYGGWPNSGEIDIMEHVGKDPNIIHSSVHNATNSGALGGTIQTASQTIADAEQEHTYGLIWSDEKISTFIDNEENIVLEYNNLPDYDSSLWPYDKDFFIILNLAIGGDWGGPNIDNTVFPQSMYIDFVKVYKYVDSRCPSNDD